MKVEVEVNTLQHAANEIQELRKVNNMQAAQLDIVEIFAAALGLRKISNGMASPDIFYELQKKIREAESTNKSQTDK